MFCNSQCLKDRQVPDSRYLARVSDVLGPTFIRWPEHFIPHTTSNHPGEHDHYLKQCSPFPCHFFDANPLNDKRSAGTSMTALSPSLTKKNTPQHPLLGQPNHTGQIRGRYNIYSHPKRRSHDCLCVCSHPTYAAQAHVCTI